MDAWFGKGAPNLRIPDVNTPSHPRLECERIFIFLLLQNYFEEDFHFTSHATISYIKKGRRAALLSKKDITIMMDVVRNPSSKMRSSSSTLQTNSKSSATSCKGFKTSQSKRPKPCIVNSESSKFGKSSTNSHKPSTPVSNKELPEVNDGIRLDSSDIEQDQDENFIFDDSDSSIEFQGIYGPTKTPKRLKLNSGFESD